MKKIIALTSIIIMVFGIIGYAANELQCPYPAGNTIYGVVRNSAGLPIEVSGMEPETWTTASRYAITMTGDNGQHYIGNMPTGITTPGTYTAYYYLQAGGTPTNGDAEIGIQEIIWSGSNKKELIDAIDSNFSDITYTGGSGIRGLNLRFVEDLTATAKLYAYAYSGSMDAIGVSRINQEISRADSNAMDELSKIDVNVTREISKNDANVLKFASDSNTVLKGSMDNNGLSITQTRNILEGDTIIDKTVSPWNIVIKKKGTSTELVRKIMKDVNGVGLTDVDTVIGRQEEP
jgi:hypothetical protein